MGILANTSCALWMLTYFDMGGGGDGCCRACKWWRSLLRCCCHRPLWLGVPVIPSAASLGLPPPAARGTGRQMSEPLALSGLGTTTMATAMRWAWNLAGNFYVSHAQLIVRRTGPRVSRRSGRRLPRTGCGVSLRPRRNSIVQLTAA